MPVKDTNVLEANTYKNLIHIGLIDDVLTRIVYTSIHAFDSICAEFKKIINGEPSEVLPELADLYAKLYTNKYKLFKDEETDEHTQFQKQLRARLETEIANYSTTEQRLQYLEQKKQELPAIPVAPIQKQRFPKKEDIGLMLQYDIARTTLEPEFRLCVGISTTLERIKEYNPAIQIPGNSLTHSLVMRIRIIYRALGMLHEIRTMTSFDQESKKLANLKALLQASKITIQQFNEDFDQGIKTYLCNYSPVILKEIRIGVVNPKVLYAYIKCRQILGMIKPAFSTWGHKKISADVPSYLELNSTVRAEICKLFADYCGIDLENTYYLALDSEEEQDIKLLRVITSLLSNIILFAIPYDVDLPTLYQVDENKLSYAFVHHEEFTTTVDALGVPIINIFKLDALAFINILKDPDPIIEHCNNAGLQPADFLCLPIEQIQLILSNDLYFPRIAVLLNFYRLPKDEFLQASLEQKKAWLMQPALAQQVHSTDALIDGFATFADEALYAGLTLEQKHYEAIEDYLSYRDFACCNSMQVSAYAYALQQNDNKLIDIISNSIMARSKAYLNVFLMRHGFNMLFKMSNPAPGILPWYNSNCTLISKSVLDAKNDKGNTPLFVAIAEGDIHAALALLVFGVNINLLNKAGQTAVEVAQQSDSRQIFYDLFYTQQYLHGRQLYFRDMRQ